MSNEKRTTFGVKQAAQKCQQSQYGYELQIRQLKYAISYYKRQCHDDVYGFSATEYLMNLRSLQNLRESVNRNASAIKDIKKEIKKYNKLFNNNVSTI